MHLFRTAFILLLMSLTISVQAQDSDTLAVTESGDVKLFGKSADIESFNVEDTTHSPRLAALYSAIVPGLGQFYNEKYWKIPLVYALGAFTAYQIKTNHQRYMTFRNVLFNIRDGNPNNNDDFDIYTQRGFTEDAVNRRVDAYKRDRDYWIILAGVFYVLNIVDATVDAHLREFNINENLSMRVEPSFQSNPYQNMQAGLMLNFRVKGKNTY